MEGPEKKKTNSMVQLCGYFRGHYFAGLSGDRDSPELLPRWLRGGKMKLQTAERQLARMEAALEVLKELKDSKCELPQKLFRLRTMGPLGLED